MSSSRLLTLALVAVLGLMPIAPPEHAHERQGQDHHDVLVHRHASPHAAGRPAVDTHHDGVVDESDAVTLVRSTLFTTPATAAGAVSAPAVVYRVLPPPPVQPLHGPVAFVEHLIHGPPRGPASLRAPPSFPAV